MASSKMTWAPVLVAVSHLQPEGHTEHFVELQGSRYVDEPDHWNSADKFEVRVAGGPGYRFSIMYLGPDAIVHNCDAKTGEHTPGHHTPGPYAALIPQDTVISAWHDPIETAVLEVEAGDTIVIRHQRFRVTPWGRYSNSYPELRHVGDQFPELAAALRERDSMVVRPKIQS